MAATAQGITARGPAGAASPAGSHSDERQLGRGDLTAHLPSLPFGDRLERDEQFQVPLVVLAAEPGKRMRGSFGASRAVPLASRPRERMPYAVTLMPSSRTTGRLCASMPRLISEYSICSAAIGATHEA